MNTSASSPPSAAAIAAIAGAQPVHVDVERQDGARLAAPRAASTSRMSAVPARPEQARLVLEPARRARAAPARPRSSSHSSRPGSTSPERVAITSPSSGVKPIVVSTERPSRTAASDAPAPRWQVTIRARRRRAAPPPGAPPRRARARGSRSGAAASARATRAAARRSPPPAAASAWNAVSKQRDGRHAAAAARRTASSAASAGGWCSGASAVSSCERGDDRVVDHAPGRRSASPPCTTRWPTASAVRRARRERRLDVDSPGARDRARRAARRPRRAAAASGCSTRR